MNKKPVRTGPSIRMTRPANRKREEPQNQDGKNYVYSCQYCHLKFTQNSHFLRHITTNHQIQQRDATFECNECNIVFNRKSNLDIHCQTQHQIKSKSKCESCAITFKSSYCLRRHMKLKQILAENSCLKCDKKYTKADDLIKHINSKHTFKNVTFACDHCHLKFKAKQSLVTHLNRIHKTL